MFKHPIIKEPLSGNGSLATITSQPFLGKAVLVCVEFSDGQCIVDFGGEEEKLHAIHKSELRFYFWKRSIQEQNATEGFHFLTEP